MAAEEARAELEDERVHVARRPESQTESALEVDGLAAAGPAEPGLLPRVDASARAELVLRMQAERGNAFVERVIDGLTRGAEGQLGAEPGSGADGNAAPVVASSGGVPAPLAVQRLGESGSGEGAPPEGAGAGAGPGTADGLIVDDSTEELAPGQMKKTDFLARTRAQVNATIDQALSGSPFAEMARPQIAAEVEQNYATYAGQGPAELERTLRQQVPGAAGAAAAEDFVTALCTEVRTQIADQLPPPDVASQLAGVGGAVASAAADIGSGLAQGAASLVSGIGSLLGKFRDGPAPAARSAASPSEIQGQLKGGTPLDSRLAQEFGTVMGSDFSSVRVHTDGNAAALSDQLDARAFTVGQDVAFGTGEYRPGTLVGDALIAHELAHVAQQSGSLSRSAPHGSDTASLEEGADLTAVAAIARLWGNLKDVSAIMAGNVLPGVRSGLRLQRCARGSGAPAAPAVVAPTVDYEVPFDQAPLSSPGEQILFNDQYKHATPALFQLKYTGTGGTFDSVGGPTTKTTPGLVSGNQPFFIDAAWDGTSAVSVKLEIQLVSDSSVKYTQTWNFGKKVNIPTTITQTEAEAETPLPAVYNYTLGPHVGAAGVDSYLHETVLETFGSRTCNITMADLNPAFKAAHPGITTDDQICAHFFGTSSNNGTFTVSAGDKMADQHGGGMPDVGVFNAALITPKEVWVDLPQTYTANPGTPLGKYTIRRICRVDGTKVVKKMKQP